MSAALRLTGPGILEVTIVFTSLPSTPPSACIVKNCHQSFNTKRLSLPWSWRGKWAASVTKQALLAECCKLYLILLLIKGCKHSRFVGMGCVKSAAQLPRGS